MDGSFYVSNLKVATGKPDTRHKLVEEGKFSTTGILFDFQSTVIKPESSMKGRLENYSKPLVLNEGLFYYNSYIVYYNPIKPSLPPACHQANLHPI